MDARRKTLGRRIKRARRDAGYGSQKAFAEAIGISESSVANAERGSDSVGDNVFQTIEGRLAWPEDSIARYLHTDGPPPWQDTTESTKPDLSKMSERQLIDYMIDAGFTGPEITERIQTLRAREQQRNAHDLGQASESDS